VFVKCCFGGEMVVVTEVIGWRAGREEEVGGVVQARHVGRGDGNGARGQEEALAMGRFRGVI